MLALFIGVVYLFTNLVFASGLIRVARKLPSNSNSFQFAPLLVWFLATIFGGPLVVLAFWMIHCSNLRENFVTSTVVLREDNRTVREQLHEEGILVYGKQVSDEQVEEYLSGS